MVALPVQPPCSRASQLAEPVGPLIEEAPHRVEDWFIDDGHLEQEVHGAAIRVRLR